MLRKAYAAWLCALCLCALTACTSTKTVSEQSAESTETTTAAAETTVTTEATTTTVTTTTTTETTTAETTTGTDSTDQTADASAETTTETTAAAGSSKLLWSERGLEAVPADSEGGYGELLTVGSEYIGWTLDSFKGEVSGTQVSSVDAEFSRASALSVNGIVTVLPESDSEYPGKMYLRVDNQADFPYFPTDSRERGYFVVENTDEVWEMLGVADPAAESGSSIAVTFAVDSLHVQLSANTRDTVKVSSASRR